MSHFLKIELYILKEAIDLLIFYQKEFSKIHAGNFCLIQMQKKVTFIDTLQQSNTDTNRFSFM